MGGNDEPMYIFVEKYEKKFYQHHTYLKKLNKQINNNKKYLELN